MDLDLVFGADAFFNKELENVASVVTLQLDDVSPLLVGKSSSIATPGLFESSEDLFEVKIVGKTLHNSQTLSGGTLLEMQIYNSNTSHVTIIVWCGQPF